MRRTFRGVDGGIEATFSGAEADLLRTLPEQLTQTLTFQDADDPILRRLFPPPVLGDDAVAHEVARELAGELLAARLEAYDELSAVLARGTEHGDGGLRVTLVEDEPLLVLGILNDVRLAIGARVDIEALDRETLSEDDPASYPLHVMDHLAWWQEQLLSIIDPSLAGDG